MLHLSLVCLLNDSNIKFRTTRVSAKPNYEKILEITLHNIATLQTILTFCYENNIQSYRVPCNLLPLWTHPLYEKMCDDVFEITKSLWKNIKTYDIHLSSHPDQFILLNSLNQDVNDRSIKDLNKWNLLCEVLPVDLVNIHIGGFQSTIEHHTSIIKENLKQLHPLIRKRLSFENDEKSYNASMVLQICKQLDVMMVPDFHHESCYHSRNNNKHNSFIIENINDIFSTYDNRNTIPTFHISSPKLGWTTDFKGCCQHADYIDSNDFPYELLDYASTKDIRLDVEAKHKQDAIFALRTELF